MDEGQGQRRSAGVDGVSIEEFGQTQKDNLYKLWNRMSSGSTFRRAGAGGGDTEGSWGGDQGAGCADGGGIVTGCAVTIWVSLSSRIRSIRCGVSGWRCCSSSAAAPAGCSCAPGCRRAGDAAGVVDRPRWAAGDASVVGPGSGRPGGGDTRDPGLLIVVAGRDILLCDEYTQERACAGRHVDARRCWRGGLGWRRGCPTWRACWWVR